MTITRNFNLHLNAGASIPLLINANQYDSGEEWVFTLYSDRGVKYTPASGAIIGLKSDGHAIANNATVNGSGQIVVTETEQMTASVGKNVFELSIDSGTHGTANFIVLVEPQPYDSSTASDSDISLFNEAINAAGEIEEIMGGETITEVISPVISDWLEDNMTNPSNPAIDTSLTVSGAAADAKVTGDAITDLNEAINPLNAITKGIYLEGDYTASEAEALSKFIYIYADGTVDLSKYRVCIIAKTDNYQRIILIPQDTEYQSSKMIYLETWNNNETVKSIADAYIGTGNVYCKFIWGENGTLVNRAYNVSPFRFDLTNVQKKIFDIENDIDDLESGKADENLPGVPSPNIQLLDIDNEVNVYDNAKVYNDATKSYSDGVITFTAPADASASKKGQIAFYGTTSTPVEDYVQSDDVPDTLTVEFDYTASNYFTLRVDTKQNTNQSLTFSAGTNKHLKKSFQNVASVKYLQFFLAYADETLAISNLKLYYGTQYDSTVYEFAADTSAKMRQIYEEPLYKKMISIGDSLTNYCIWQPYVAKLVKASEYSRVGISGSSIANTGASSIYANVQNMTADENVDLITVWGGTNDWHSNITIGDFDTQLVSATRDTSTFYGGYIGIVEKLMELYPKARVVLIGTTPRAENNGVDNYQNQTNAGGKYLRDYVDAVKVVAEYYGFPFLDLLRKSGINVLNITQYMERQGSEGAYYYLHLNDWGTKMIGIQIGHFINAIGR